MIIDKKEFDSIPQGSKERLEIKGECECCGCDIDLFEVTECPLSDSDTWAKNFQAYCGKCDAHYKIKKSIFVKRKQR